MRLALDTFRLRPAVAGARLQDPVTGDRLPDEGVRKPRNAYWLGLLIRGDVAEVPRRARVDAAPDPAPEPPGAA